MNQDASPEGLLEQDLSREIERGRVVIVVGSGVSVAATGNRPVASWVGLEDGVSRCEQLFLTLPDGWGNGLRAKLRSGDAEDLLYVADEVARALGAPTDGEYRRWLRETIGGLRAEHREVIAALSDLDVLDRHDELRLADRRGDRPRAGDVERRRSHRAGAP